jgi:hypothetical protein
VINQIRQWERLRLKATQIVITIVVIALVGGGAILLYDETSGPSVSSSVSTNASLVSELDCFGSNAYTTVALRVNSTSTSTSITTYSGPGEMEFDYRTNTTVAAPVGTVVTTTTTFASSSGNVVSEWEAVTCTYVK